MVVAIHQPEFLPWLGFFDKMKKADKYIVFDNVQFKKRYFENRNKIKQNDGPVWITVPVKSKGRYVQKINEVKIDNGSLWQKKIWNKIKHCYSKSPHLNEFENEIKDIIFSGKHEFLLDLNLAFIMWFRRVLGVNTPVEFSSDLGVEEYKASDLILEICRVSGATQYLCGPSGKNYLNLDDFCQAGIEVVWQEFKHPRYFQQGRDFIPSLSALDIVLNCGTMSSDILFGSA